MTLLQTSVSSPLLLALTAAYFFCAALTTFDIRLIQAKRKGLLPADTPETPSWTGLFGYAMWGLWLGIFLLNWWYALLMFVVKFALKVLPVLETVGAYLYSAIIGKELPALVTSTYSLQASHQKLAGKALKKMQKGEPINEVSNSFRYEQLLTTLNSIKHGTAPPEQKKLISVELIKSASLSPQERHDLIAQTEEIYNAQSAQ